MPKYEVTEYQIHTGCCKDCGKNHKGHAPLDAQKSMFGSRLHAFVGLATSKYRVSKRQAVDLLSDLYSLPVSLGSISNIEHRISRSLEPSYIEIAKNVRKSRINYIDETSYKQNNRNGWAWLLASDNYSLFHLHNSRGKKVAKSLIKDFSTKVIVSDRYPVYDYLPARNHQVCWAHLKRDFIKISERPGNPGKIGKELLKAYKALFIIWKTRTSQELLYHRKTKKKIRKWRNRILKTLIYGATCQHKVTARACENILSQGDSLWHFLCDPTIPATNNLAERQLRTLVIHKKLSFGARSNRGSRYIERIFSLVSSFKQQGKAVLPYLLESISSHLENKDIPSIEPYLA